MKYKFFAKKIGNYLTRLSERAKVSDTIKRPSETITNALGAEKTKIIEEFNSKKLNKDVLVIQNKPENVTKVEVKTPVEKKVVENLLSQEHPNNATKKVLESHSKSEVKSVSVTPVLAKTGENNKLNYMLGIWVRDDMAGIGPMTYYDDNGNYGALGHGIGDGETGELLKLDKGYLYEADILGIKRGQRGDPGELEGVISYRKTSMLGTVRQNSDIGIYGKLNDEYINGIKDKNKPYLLGFKQDLKTGEAYIISDVSGERQAYHIMMDSFDYSPSDRNKGIHFYVDDERLLSLTGGIVQGMSGSPIIQDGRIVGAVTHVLIQDSSRGYGIFIDEMLSQK